MNLSLFTQIMIAIIAIILALRAHSIVARQAGTSVEFRYRAK